jgi:hypothetical protein
MSEMETPKRRRGRPRGSGRRTGPPTPRGFTVLYLDPEASRAFRETIHRHGMKQYVLMSRLVTWFAGADDLVQTSILGLLGDAHVGLLAARRLEALNESHP